ncbi:MAG: hypothetical protein ACKVQA_11915 [Burkholderiales bacterium]
MQWLKRIGKTLLSLVGTVVAILLVLAGINLIDEDLNLAIQPMLQVRAMSLAPERNGYFYLLGFSAAADKDPHAVGLEIDQLARAHFSNGGSLLVEPRIDAKVAGEAPPLPKGTHSLCDPRRDPCLDRYLSASSLAGLEQAAAPYLMRYARLTAYPGYEDRPPYTYHDLYPVYGDVSVTSRLVVARAAQMIAAGRHREGAQRIAGDIRFWRQELAGSNHLLGKMMAWNRITADLKLINELIARYPAFAAKQSTLLAQMTLPLNPAETEFCIVSRNERTAVIRLHHAFGRSPWQSRKELRDLEQLSDSLIAKYFSLVAPVGYLSNATLNLIAEVHAAEALVCDAKPAALPQALREAKTRVTALMHKRTSGLAMLYNPAGKALHDPDYPSFEEEYRFRLHDLDGYLRATALHARIRATGSKGGAIPALIAQAGENYHDPYTGKPVVWNPPEHMLAVTQNAKANGKAGGVAVVELGK